MLETRKLLSPDDDVVSLGVRQKDGGVRRRCKDETIEFEDCCSMGVECLAGSKNGGFEAVGSLALDVAGRRKSSFDMFGEEEVSKDLAHDNIWQGWQREWLFGDY